MRIENKILKAVDKYIETNKENADAQDHTMEGNKRACDYLKKANAGSDIQLIILGIIEREG